MGSSGGGEGVGYYLRMLINISLESALAIESSMHVARAFLPVVFAATE